jgi:eukaryotic-like serine/threonine-protein kinase
MSNVTTGERRGRRGGRTVGPHESDSSQVPLATQARRPHIPDDAPKPPTPVMSDDFFKRIADILGSGYVVERELGAGMSRVVVVRDVALGRQIVVKVLPADWAAGLSAERFRREVILAAGLQHPHIVPLLAAAEAPDGTLYYSMPYIDGQSLRSRLKDGIPSLSDSVRWLRDVASALEYAHERGIVHRDMKPDNVLSRGVTHSLPTSASPRH